MKSYRVAALNRYPGCSVQSSESSFNVFDAKGIHIIAIEKNGAGQWVDRSREYGLSGEWSLAPIPRDARVHKLSKSGDIVLDERHEERKTKRSQFLDNSNRVQSCEELSAKGWEFSKEGDVKRSIQEKN